MDRATLLTPVPCDVKRLPLGPAEAFVLSQVDGRSTLEDIAHITGISVAEATRLASRLVELGAVTASEPPARGRATDDDEHDIDDATRAKIFELDGRLAALDHYALLGVERDVDKKTIKRAYFALASAFHPDRFFGKKLGKARAPLDRIFTRLTEAHDTLADRARRAVYDATLPAAPPRPRPPHTARPTKRSLHATKAPARATKPPARATKPPARATKPPARATKPPAAGATKPPAGATKSPASAAKLQARATRPPARRTKPPSRTTRPALRASKPPPRRSSRSAKTVDAPADGLRRVYASARQAEVQRRVDIFVQAAEEALQRGDVVSAANNFRLALENTSDPALRAKLEAIDGAARERTHVMSLARARAAEKLERWSDAASYFARANAARPEAASAERAANAMRMAGLDLRRAAELAEQAVTAEPRNAAYRVTLGEIYLAAKMPARAAGEAQRALAIAPHDKAAKALAAAAAKARA